MTRVTQEARCGRESGLTLFRKTPGFVRLVAIMAAALTELTTIPYR
jgi:hypothetical protein